MICRLRYPENEYGFRDFLSEGTDAPVAEFGNAEFESIKKLYPPEADDAAVEYTELASKASDILLHSGCCVFHGVAFLWRGRAWIFTAPSGTGKSTQYVLWKMLYGGEISIINGDKPVLEKRRDGSVWVHPSPWTGKEGMGRSESAPLGGIICLQRGENSICRMSAAQAVLPVFGQIMYTPDTEEAVQRACAMAEAILGSAPVWQLTNRGDEASARLTHDTLMKEAE